VSGDAIAFDVKLAPSRAQRLFALLGAVVPWLLLRELTLGGNAALGGKPVIGAGVAFVAYLAEMGYLIFLATQSVRGEIDAASIRLGEVTRLSRQGARVWLRHWTHLPRGAVLVVESGPDTLAIAVRRRLLPGAEAESASFGVDARLHADDLEACLAALNASHLAASFAPARPASKHSFSGILPWMFTIVILGISGGVMGVFFPGLAATREGQLFMTSYTFAGVALGMVWTFGAWAESPTARRMKRAGNAGFPPVVRATATSGRPSFWRAFVNLGSFTAIAWFVSAVLIGPVVGIGWLFGHFVDDPGCAADCAERGLRFGSYIMRKTGSLCTCLDANGMSSSFRTSYNVTGGHSFGDGVLDFLIRAVVFIVGVGICYVVFFVVASSLRTLWKKIRRGVTE
jgi:hypothetical protein